MGGAPGGVSVSVPGTPRALTLIEISKRVKQKKRLFKSRHIHARENFTVIKNEQTRDSRGTEIHFECIRLSERSQTQEHRLCGSVSTNSKDEQS